MCPGGRLGLGLHCIVLYCKERRFVLIGCCWRVVTVLIITRLSNQRAVLYHLGSCLVSTNSFPGC